MIVALVAGSGALGAAIDLRSRRVPNWLTLGITVAGLTLAAVRLSGLSFPAALAARICFQASPPAESTGPYGIQGVQL